MAPAIIITPVNPKTGNGYKIEGWGDCENKTKVHFIQCIEEITYSAREIIPYYIVGHGMDYYDDYVNITDYEDKDLEVKNFFDGFGGLAKSVEINNYAMISHDQYSTLILELNGNLSYEIYFMDRKMQYIFGSPNIIPRPVLTLKPNPGGVYPYLKVLKHEKLNQPNQPCNPSPEYDFTFCLEKNIITSVGCQPPWRRYNLDSQLVCDNMSMLNKYDYKMNEFYSMYAILQ